MRESLTGAVGGLFGEPSDRNVGITAAVIVVMAAIPVLVMYPWLGLAATFLAAPLKTLPGGSGPINVAKGCAVLTVLCWLVRMTGRDRGIRLTGLEVGIGWVLAVFLISMCNRPRPGDELVSIISLISLWGLAILVCNLCTEEKLLRRMTLILMVSAIFPVLVAIYQVITRTDPFGGRLGNFYPWVRAHGTYSLCTQFSSDMVPLALLGATMMAFRCTRKWWLCLLVPTSVLGILLALGRGSMMGLFVGGGYLVLRGLGQMHGLKWNMRAWQKALGLTILVLMLGLLFNWASTKERLSYERTMSGGSSLRRLREFSLTKEMLAESPLFGVGFSGYTERIDKKIAEGKVPGKYYGRKLHNIVLRFLACGGLFGLLGLGALVVCIVRRSRPPYPLEHDRPSNVVLLGCRVALIGMIPDMLTHGGIFGNNLWGILGILAAARSIADLERAPTAAPKRSLGACESPAPQPDPGSQESESVS